MAAAAPAAASAAAPAAAGAAGKGAGTAAAAGAGGGGLMGFLASPTGQVVASTVLGIAASQNPQTAQGVRSGVGAYGMLQDLTDKRNVAQALQGYSESVDSSVRKEVMDRQMNEAIMSLGSEDPSGGTVRTTYEGQPLESLKAYGAAARALPAIGAAAPQSAGYVMADVARRAPSPTPRTPNLYDTVDQFLAIAKTPGIDLTADMNAKGETVYRMSEEAEKAETPIKEEPRLSAEEQAALIESIRNAPTGIEHRAQYTGPGGAKHTLTSRVLPPSGGGRPGSQGGLIQVSIGGTEFLYNRATGEYMPIPPEVMSQLAEVQALKDTGGIAGTVVRNPDGTLSVRR